MPVTKAEYAEDEKAWNPVRDQLVPFERKVHFGTVLTRLPAKRKGIQE
jgi:hypothetical protein